MTNELISSNQTCTKILLVPNNNNVKVVFIFEVRSASLFVQRRRNIVAKTDIELSA